MNNIIKNIAYFTCHRTTRKVVYIMCIIGLIACVILLFSLLNTGDRDLKNKLDALDQKSKQLEQTQLKYDSLIAVQQGIVKDLDFRINNIKEKTTIIREYYKEKAAKVDSFSINQLDSFFRNKYQY